MTRSGVSLGAALHALADRKAGVGEHPSPLELLARWVELAQQERQLSVMNPHDPAPFERTTRRRRMVNESHADVTELQKREEVRRQRQTVDEARGEVCLAFLKVDAQMRLLDPAEIRKLAALEADR